LEETYLSARTPKARRMAALAGFATLLLWLGWLRSSETFDACWSDFDVVEPKDGPTMDLRRGCGVVGIRLGPDAKSSCTTPVDMSMAHQTLLGYHIGKWFHQARQSLGVGAEFAHASGTPWTLCYCWHAFLYPSLKKQRAGGDAMLLAFDGYPGNTLKAKFWSLHCFRRGSRSQEVSWGRKFGCHRFRKAFKSQIYEHGRWRNGWSGKDIDMTCHAGTLMEKIQITLHCM
jgi:hypothetical protein